MHPRRTSLAPPPDFRYVGLAPTRAARPLATLLLGAGLAGTAGFVGLERHAIIAAAALAAGCIAVRVGCASILRPLGARECVMAIVPWGVILGADRDGRTLRWPAVRDVKVEVKHVIEGGTPRVVETLVRVETEHEILAGRTPGEAGLERLTVHLSAYADEAARPISLDLDGHDAFEEEGLESALARVFHAADELCSTSAGAATLALPSGDYRSVARSTASPETVAILRRALSDSASSPADPRALAAAVAARLDAQALVPDLLRLVNAPSPRVAAAAKVAAVRLGAAVTRAGSLEGVAAFLSDDDRLALSDWVASLQRAFRVGDRCGDDGT